jgi:hypothetical protein
MIERQRSLKGENVISRNRPGRTVNTALALIALAALAAACSGGAGSPEGAVRKMVGAYGGEKNIPKLTSMEGRGFRKQLPLGHVATNYPLDVFQDGMKYKSRAYRVRDGQVVDVQLLVIGDTERFSWSRKTGAAVVSEWEVEMMSYRLPMILERLARGDLDLEHAESAYWDGLYHVKFTEGDNVVDVGLDENSFLVSQVEISSVSDTSFTFKEEYRDYVKTDGIWYPNRFVGSYKGYDYFEFLIPVVRFGVEFPEGFFTVAPEDTSRAQ